jgi:hypothetical protein
MKDSKIIPVARTVDGQRVLFSVPPLRVIGREVTKWSASCGTYGQGGPGFFGLHLHKTDTYPAEWLMLRLW